MDKVTYLFGKPRPAEGEMLPEVAARYAELEEIDGKMTDLLAPVLCAVPKTDEPNAGDYACVGIASFIQYAWESGMSPHDLRVVTEQMIADWENQS